MTKSIFVRSFPTDSETAGLIYDCFSWDGCYSSPESRWCMHILPSGRALITERIIVSMDEFYNLTWAGRTHFLPNGVVFIRWTHKQVLSHEIGHALLVTNNRGSLAKNPRADNFKNVFSEEDVCDALGDFSYDVIALTNHILANSALLREPAS